MDSKIKRTTGIPGTLVNKIRYFHDFNDTGRKNGPAIITPDGEERWYYHSVFFRFPMYKKNKSCIINRFGERFKVRNGYWIRINEQ